MFRSAARARRPDRLPREEGGVGVDQLEKSGSCAASSPGRVHGTNALAALFGGIVGVRCMRDHVAHSDVVSGSRVRPSGCARRGHGSTPLVGFLLRRGRVDVLEPPRLALAPGRRCGTPRVGRRSSAATLPLAVSLASEVCSRRHRSMARVWGGHDESSSCQTND